MWHNGGIVAEAQRLYIFALMAFNGFGGVFTCLLWLSLIAGDFWRTVACFVLFACVRFVTCCCISGENSAFIGFLCPLVLL